MSPEGPPEPAVERHDQALESNLPEADWQIQPEAQQVKDTIRKSISSPKSRTPSPRSSITIQTGSKKDWARKKRAQSCK